MDVLSRCVAELSNNLNSYNKYRDLDKLINSSQETIKQFRLTLQNLKQNGISEKDRNDGPKLKRIVEEFDHHSRTINQIIQNNKVNTSGPNLTFIDLDDEEEERISIVQAAKNQENQHHLELVRQRNAEIQKLSHDMLIIHEIMGDLNNLINIQGETLNNIESNVTQADYHVEVGVKDLEKAKDTQNSNRKCMIILVVVLIILILVIVLPIVLKFTSNNN